MDQKQVKRDGHAWHVEGVKPRAYPADVSKAILSRS